MLSLNFSSLSKSSSLLKASIFVASIPAFFAPFIATVATGIPPGIWTIEYSESTPPRSEVFIGTPITGSGVSAAHIPGRCAAFPAPAITVFIPLFFKSLAHAKKISGSLCAEMILYSYSTPISFRKSPAALITFKSESLPITIATSTILTSIVKNNIIV